MLYIVLAYLMLSAAITNAVCLNTASFSFSFLSLICANAFYSLAFSLFITFFFNLHHAQCFKSVCFS